MITHKNESVQTNSPQGELIEVHVSSIVNEVIKVISSLLFCTKIFKCPTTCHKQRPTNKTKTSEQKTTKATIFRVHKNFQGGRNCLFCALVLFARLRSFCKKINRLEIVLITSFTILLMTISVKLQLVKLFRLNSFIKSVSMKI